MVFSGSGAGNSSICIMLTIISQNLFHQGFDSFHKDDVTRVLDLSLNPLISELISQLSNDFLSEINSPLRMCFSTDLSRAA